MTTEVKYPFTLKGRVTARTRDWYARAFKTRGYETVGALVRRALEYYVLEHTPEQHRDGVLSD